MKDKPDFGYDTYKGTGKLKDLVSCLSRMSKSGSAFV
jgi:hypothetical protein